MGVFFFSENFFYLAVVLIACHFVVYAIWGYLCNMRRNRTRWRKLTLLLYLTHKLDVTSTHTQTFDGDTEIDWLFPTTSSTLAGSFFFAILFRVRSFIDSHLAPTLLPARELTPWLIVKVLFRGLNAHLQEFQSIETEILHHFQACCRGGFHRKPTYSTATYVNPPPPYEQYIGWGGFTRIVYW